MAHGSENFVGSVVFAQRLHALGAVAFRQALSGIVDHERHVGELRHSEAELFLEVDLLHA